MGNGKFTFIEKKALRRPGETPLQIKKSKVWAPGLFELHMTTVLAFASVEGCQ